MNDRLGVTIVLAVLPQISRSDNQSLTSISSRREILISHEPITNCGETLLIYVFPHRKIQSQVATLVPSSGALVITCHRQGPRSPRTRFLRLFMILQPYPRALLCSYPDPLRWPPVPSRVPLGPLLGRSGLESHEQQRSLVHAHDRFLLEQQ